MAAGRSIVYSQQCEIDVERFGGWHLLDRVLEPILDGLSRNPYGFPKYESDWCSVRYVPTLPLGSVPPLMWVFTIEPQTVTFQYVEEAERY